MSNLPGLVAAIAVLNVQTLQRRPLIVLVRAWPGFGAASLCSHQVPACLEKSVANSRRAETVAETDVAAAVMLAMRFAADQLGEKGEQPVPRARFVFLPQPDREIIA